jgi:hypothetical protein
VIDWNAGGRAPVPVVRIVVGIDAPSGRPKNAGCGAARVVVSSVTCRCTYSWCLQHAVRQ